MMRPRVYILVLIIIGFILSFSPLPSITQAQSGPVGVTTVNLNVRSGPGSIYPVITVLPINTTVMIQGRNAAADWLHIVADDLQISGWVAAPYLTTTFPLDQLSITPITTDQQNEASDATDTAITVTFPGSVIGHAHTIYQRGQALGNNPNVFIKIGDSNSAGNAFFCNFQWGTYRLGDYTELQETITFFNQSGSFCASNMAAQTGFTDASLLDPTWADPRLCEAGESVLECEYRRKKPSVAIIYMTLAFSPAEQYYNNMGAVIQYLIDHGVIPILTAPALSHSVEEGVTEHYYNPVLRILSDQYQVPLIEFGHEAASLPNQGCGADGYHLSYNVNGIYFTGDEKRFGRTLRELMTLQALDILRTEVFQLR